MNSLLGCITAYFNAVRAIATSATLIGLCIIPWLAGVTVWILLFIISLFFRDELSLLLFSTMATWLTILVEGALIPVLFLLSAVVAVLISLILCEFTTDPLIIRLLERNGSSRTPERTFLQQARDALARLLIVTPLSIICFLFGLIPLVGVPFLLLSFFVVGYGLLDLPLSIRGDPLGTRLHFMKNNWVSVLGTGAIFALSFFIPGLSLLLLPVGYAAAVFVIQQCDAKAQLR